MAAAEPKVPKVASSEIVRDINRRAVLNLIRTRQPISRADLARASGLQRSTISLIVEQLIRENWVIEGPTGRLPRGRRPTYLHLNHARAIIGVDVRPTQTTVVLSDVNGSFTAQEILATSPDPKAAMRELTQAVRRMAVLGRGKKIEGVGISLPGRFDEGASKLVFAPNLGWGPVDIRNPLAKATGLEVELENAANACVLAAVWFDHAPERNLVVITVSEGVGAGVLVDGRLVRGLGGMAGEFGHVQVDPRGPACGCGSRGCWEVFASNRSALRYYSEAGGDPSVQSFAALMSRADYGDERAASALESMAHHLGRGMRMVAAGLAPERIVVVGELTNAWARFGPIIESEVSAQALGGGPPARVTPAGEGGMARLRGTVALVLQKHFSEP
jgi:predicted NBD/HSP70 family sugar kinase